MKKGTGAVKAKGNGQGAASGTAGGKSNEAPDVDCWNCGKTGHRASECWCKPNSQGKRAGAQAHQRGHQGGKKGKGKGNHKGKGANSLKEEPEEEAQAASYSDISVVDLQPRPPRTGTSMHRAGCASPTTRAQRSRPFPSTPGWARRPRPTKRPIRRPVARSLKAQGCAEARHTGAEGREAHRSRGLEAEKRDAAF